MEPQKKTVLFFAPFAGLWQHSFPEFLVAESLKKDGFRVIFVRCRGLFKDHCITMAAVGLTPGSPTSEKQRVCRKCKAACDLQDRALGGEVLYVDDFCERSDVEELEPLLRDWSAKRAGQFQVDGVEIGKFAAYETLLEFKKLDWGFDPVADRSFRTSLVNAVGAYRALGRIFDQVRPSVVAVANSFYSIHAAARLQCRARGVPLKVLQAGGNLSDRLGSLYISKDYTFAHVLEMKWRWKEFRNRVATPEAISRVGEHFRELLSGKNVFAYSTPKGVGGVSIREKFGISRDQKLLVATMSSLDERFAAELVDGIETDPDPLFRDQVEWVTEIAQYLSNRPDLFLLIRVHPREFPNKRETVLSDHAKRLKVAFSNLPRNVRVNWPTDQVSLYDLAAEMDLCLTAWSSTGKEMAMLGIPTLHFSSALPLYPASLGYLGGTRADYFDQIDVALRDGFQFEKVREVFRWLALEFSDALIWINEAYVSEERRKAPFWLRVIRKLFKSVDPVLYERWVLSRRPKRLRSASWISYLFGNPESHIVDYLQQNAGTNVTGLEHDLEAQAIREVLVELHRAIGRKLPNLGSI